MREISGREPLYLYLRWMKVIEYSLQLKLPKVGKESREVKLNFHMAFNAFEACYEKNKKKVIL